MSNLVIVIDMQRGFVDPEGALYVGEKGQGIIPELRKIIETEAGQGSQLVFTVDTHDPDDLEFKMWPPHCIRGTWECEITPELAEFTQGARIQPKRRYSAFFETDLAEYLEKLRLERVIIGGVCTDICVMHTVADLRNRDYEVIVPANAVASFDPAAHDFALQHMEKILGATVVPSYESWREEEAQSHG